ncbi:MAG TPA: oxidoreductase [Nocardioides sp.]|nr:oxidoreductase [Nocardioides sp.]
MRVLILGGTAWLGRTLALAAAERGHDVTCLARGETGDPPAGVRFVRGDRRTTEGYAAVAGEEWDVCVDVARQPVHVRTAVAALPGVRHYVFVSTGNVYADHATPGQDESAPLLAPLEADEFTDPEDYGPAKVACELAVSAAFPDRTLLVRAGLIGGPGDWSGRSGYWPHRFAHPADPEGRVLVPDVPELVTQVLDVRDLASWILDSAEQGRTGVVNATGPAVPLAEHLATAREVAGHTGPVVGVPPEWLVEQGVATWMGPRSLPLWLPLPEYAGFSSRVSTDGPVGRPLAETLADTLAWEQTRGEDSPRQTGLTDEEERELLRLRS